jgi:hypothetical protein
MMDKHIIQDIIQAYENIIQEIIKEIIQEIIQIYENIIQEYERLYLKWWISMKHYI